MLKLELTGVAPEIVRAWEVSHKCNLRKTRLRHALLGRLTILSFLIALLGSVLTSVGITEVLARRYHIAIAIVLMMTGMLVFLGQLLIIGDILRKMEGVLCNFNDDILKLKSQLGDNIAHCRSTAGEAGVALQKMAVSVRLAQLEGDELKAIVLRLEMVSWYNFFASFDLVPIPTDPENPRLQPYFDGALEGVRAIVEEMAKQLELLSD